ncbi:MAG: hypothetical protein KGI58_01080 [Patescibacteria group bacterium]|nr:hypothetical protein [Patescibacteria group bacterium]
MNIKKYFYAIIALTLLGTMATVVPVFAESNNDQSTQLNNWGNRGFMGFMHGHREGPAVIGTVSAINGNTITVNGKQGFGTNAVASTFTVDATNARITKGNVVGTISSIIVGDTIVVHGTISGTNVTATNIHDGIVVRNDNDAANTIKQGIPAIMGNGEPVVAGNVSAISGSTITITNKSNVSYTVDATNAKITQGPNIILISNIAVGDTLIVQGTVNGNSIVATSVVDQNRPVNTSIPTNAEQPHRGFFGSIGLFFMHMFGF